MSKENDPQTKTVTERRYDENNNLKLVVVVYEIKENIDEDILIKKCERDWDPEVDS